jgi:methionyl-tRNA formyltransferase
MDAGLDTGAMLLRESIAIRPDDSTATLHDRLAPLGASLVVRALELASRGELVARPQPEAGVTWANKVEKSEAPIDWRDPAVVIERRIRAFDPFPGASCAIGGEVVKCWRARVEDGAGDPGTVLGADDAGIVVACGEAALRLIELQRPGGKRISARQWLQRARIEPGMRFAPAAD